MDTKFVGYLLLVAGVGLILFSFINTYRVFTGSGDPYKLFTQTGISLDLRQLLGEQTPPSLNLPVSTSGAQLELLSADSMNRLFNFSFYLVFMSFVASIGFRLASLGNQLLRPIEVHLKSVDSKTTSN